MRRAQVEPASVALREGLAEATAALKPRDSKPAPSSTPTSTGECCAADRRSLCGVPCLSLLGRIRARVKLPNPNPNPNPTLTLTLTLTLTHTCEVSLGVVNCSICLG